MALTKLSGEVLWACWEAVTLQSLRPGQRGMEGGFMGDGRRRSQPAPRPGLAALSQQGIAEHALAEHALLVDDAKAARYTEDEYAG